MIKLIVALLIILASAASAAAAPYALLSFDGTQVLEVREWATVPADTTSGTPNQYWLPYEVTDPPFNPATQVRTGPVRTILSDKVTLVWTVRAKTAAELDADKDGALNAADSVLFQIAFNHENRVRALEGKAALTAAQFRAAVKAQLP